jgi:DNA-binding transcriptional ArsR family regulator
MALDLSFISIDVVILAVLAYVVGLVSVMAYHRLSSSRRYRPEDSVAEAIVMEYTRRLKDYDRAIAEVRARLDVMEIRAQGLQSHVIAPANVASQTSQVGSYTRPVSEPVTITQPQPVTANAEERFEGQNGTTDYILKLLAERSRTSREVQQAIGRTREHTARLMKKLTDAGLVDRQVNSKPFRYTITEAGRARLKGKAAVEVPSEVQTAV